MSQQNADLSSCEWELRGTGIGLYVAPRVCGKPAKASVGSSLVARRDVCGTHLRSALRRGWKEQNDGSSGGAS